MVHFTHGTREVGSHIMGIVKSSATYIFIVKSIHLKWYLDFPQAFKDALYKVVVESISVGVWI